MYNAGPLSMIQMASQS